MEEIGVPASAFDGSESTVRFDGSVSGRVYMIFKTQFGLKGSKEVRAW